MSFKWGRALIIVFWITCFSYFSVSHADSNLAEKQPSDVLTLLYKVSNHIEIIAKYMGKDPSNCSKFIVSNARPREVYFQAIRLRKKANQLYYEVTDQEVIEQNNLMDQRKQISPSTVYKVVNNIEGTLRKIENFYKIEEGVTYKRAPKDTEPKDVYNQLLIDNQILDQLLDNHASPADSYRVATTSVYYAGELLETMPGVSHIVDEPDYVVNKTADSVVDQQIAIIGKIKKINDVLNIKMLTLTRTQCKRQSNNVNIQELSYIIFSEIVHIAKEKGVSLKNLEGYYPGKKYPSDIYQRNALLSRQLDLILRYVTKHPQWLEKK